MHHIIIDTLRSFFFFFEMHFLNKLKVPLELSLASSEEKVKYRLGATTIGRILVNIISKALSLNRYLLTLAIIISRTQKGTNDKLHFDALFNLSLSHSLTLSLYLPYLSTSHSLSHSLFTSLSHTHRRIQVTTHTFSFLICPHSFLVFV